MTDLILIDALVNFMGITTPDDTTATLTRSATKLMTVDQSWDKDTWQGGVIELVDGNAANLKQVILASAADQFTLMSRFYRNRRPNAGDTVKISGGPLSKAIIYNGEPESIQSEWDRGTQFFVFVDSAEGLASLEGMGARSNHGARAYRESVGFEIAVLTPSITGSTPTAEDALRVYHHLPLLRSQVVSRIYAYANDAESGLKGPGQIAWGKVFLQKPGAETALKGFLIECDFECI